MRRLIAILPIGPFRVALLETDEPLEEGTASAIWNGEAHEIVLDAALVGPKRWSILFHELVHAISDLGDLEIDDEHVCTALGNGLTQALAAYIGQPPRANPPVPLPIDDEKTPTVDIEPLTRGDQIK